MPHLSFSFCKVAGREVAASKVEFNLGRCANMRMLSPLSLGAAVRTKFKPRIRLSSFCASCKRALALPLSALDGFHHQTDPSVQPPCLTGCSCSCC